MIFQFQYMLNFVVSKSSNAVLLRKNTFKNYFFHPHNKFKHIMGDLNVDLTSKTECIKQFVTFFIILWFNL